MITYGHDAAAASALQYSWRRALRRCLKHQDSVNGIGRNPRTIRVTIGDVVAGVQGDGSHCFQAIGAYLKSLGK